MAGCQSRFTSGWDASALRAGSVAETFASCRSLALPGNAQDGVGTGVEHEDRRVHQPVEGVQRRGRPQRQQLGLADRPGLGRQLADDDVQVGNDEERREEGDAVHQCRRLDAEAGQHGFEQVGEGRLADPAKPQRGQGDAQLAGREVGIHLVVHGAQDVPAPAMRLGQGIDLGRAQTHDGELRGDEERTERDQQRGHQDHGQRVVGHGCSS